MVDLDPQHELPEPEKPLELPTEEPEWWKWILSLIVSSLASLTVTTVLLARGTGVIAVAVIVPVIFVITTILIHAVTERAR